MENMQAQKKKTMFKNSNKAFTKGCVLSFTIAISVFSSLFEEKALFITLLVQSINNIYDFHSKANNHKYTKNIKNEAVCIIIFSLFVVVYAIIGLTQMYSLTSVYVVKFLFIYFVAVSAIFTFCDYVRLLHMENDE